MYRTACVFVLAAAVAVSPSAGNAATLTFAGVPNGEAGCAFSGNPESIVESGFTISNCPGSFGASGNIHLDDAGSAFNDHVDFSTDRVFSAESVVISANASEFFFVDSVSDERVPYDNVLFEGFLNGSIVATQAYSTFAQTGLATVLFDPSFSTLDLLRITQVLPGPDDLVMFPNAECVTFPCAHISLEEIVLQPIPLPAGIALLSSAFALTAIAVRRRRRGPGLATA